MSRPNRHGDTHDKLAATIAAAAGLLANGAQDASRIKAACKAVAEDPELCGRRDLLWGDYERVLQDDKTYTLDEAVLWLASKGVDAKRASVHRDRLRVREQTRAIRLTAERSRAVLELAEASGENDILRGGRILAGQILFETLSMLPANSLGGLEAPQILKMIEALSRLSKSHAETDLIQARLAEARQRFDDEIARAKKTGKGDGKISDEQIRQIRTAVFGEAA